MEAYFHNDPRIQEWINQIMEKTFTVCILTGVDSDAEFQKGCQIVIKLTSLLQEIPTLPSEFLADGVKQLLEQQLPDARVINNFPTFRATLDRMLNEGILKATDTQKKDVFNSLASSTESTKETNVGSHDRCTERPMEASHIEFDTNSVIPALATANISHSEKLQIAETLAQAEMQAKADALALAQAEARLAEALSQAEARAKADALALAEALAQAEIQAKADALALAEALAQAEAQAIADAQTLAEALTQAEARAKADVQALTEALAQAETQAKADALALAEALSQAEAPTRADAQELSEALTQADLKFEAVTEAERNELAEPISNTNDYLKTSIHAKIAQVFHPTQVLKQEDLLKRVLGNIYPKGTVYWNKSIMGQTFLAQVEDILIFHNDPEYPLNLEKFYMDGWKVLVCSTEDLSFPRRLERKIRLIHRSGKTISDEARKAF